MWQVAFIILKQTKKTYLEFALGNEFDWSAPPPWQTQQLVVTPFESTIRGQRLNTTLPEQQLIDRLAKRTRLKWV